MLFFSNYNVYSSPSLPPPPSPSPSPSSSFVRKTKKHSARGRCDDLATVKAAAWAWYQRNEGKPVRDFGLIRDRVISRPTRYKIEAMRNIVSRENRVLAESRVPRWLGFSNPQNQIHDSQLLETHEMKRISKRMIDYLHPNSFPVGLDNFKDYERENKNKCDGEGSKIDDGKTKISMAKLLKGILLRPTVVCGRNADVEANAFLGKIRVAGFGRRM